MKKSKEEITEVLFNSFQACNHFKIADRSRRVVLKKYEGQEMTLENWEKALKESKLLK